MGFEFFIDETLCTGCGNCVVVCPVDALNSADIAGGKGGSGEMLTRLVSSGRAVRVNAELCNGCGTCMLSCPADALVLISDEPEERTRIVEAEDTDLVGVKAEIYWLLRNRDSMTIPQIAGELGIGNREVFLHLMALKREDRVFEAERLGGRFAYTTVKPQPVKVEEERGEEIVVDRERAERIRKRLEEAMSSFTQAKVRLMIESNKLDRAVEVVAKKQRKGGGKE